MQAISIVYVSFHIIHFVQKARNLYLQLWCNDPDCEKTDTEQTNIHLLSLLYIYIVNR